MLQTESAQTHRDDMELGREAAFDMHSEPLIVWSARYEFHGQVETKQMEWLDSCILMVAAEARASAVAERTPEIADRE